MTRRIGYLEGPELRGALLAACEHVQRSRAELNRINVFPVPDGDTGTNFALTVRSIADRLRHNTDTSVARVASVAAEAGILGARGNCGMILSHYLLGFSEAVTGRRRLSVAEFASALRAAVEHVYRSLERPVEGTILTVMREIAEEAEQHLRLKDFRALFKRLLVRAYEALARTPELLPALKLAGVVDAGAKGFVHWLEGIVAYISGNPVVALEEAPDYGESPLAAAQAAYPTAAETYRFCTEAMVRGAGLPAEAEVRAALGTRGDSLVVIRSGELLKLHIHTDEPDEVFAYLRGLGQLVTHKAEDMHVQHAALGREGGHLQLARRPVALVADSGCDLPDEVIRAHGIQLVPLNLIFGDHVLRDGVDISTEQFTQRLVEGAHPTTSQPTPGAFAEAFTEAAELGEEVVAVLLSSALSGTYASGQAAAKHFERGPLHLFDSRAVTLAQGRLLLKSAELAVIGTPPAEILRELDRIRNQSGLFFTVDSFERLLASGRVGRGRAWIGTLLDIKPILELDGAGKIVPLARVRSRKNVLPKVLESLAERVPAGARKLRFGVVHVAAPEVAAEVAAALRQRYPQAEILTAPVSPVLATHTGPGAWGLAYQVED